VASTPLSWAVGHAAISRSECSIDGESMAALCVNRFLSLVKAEHEAGQSESTVFLEVFGVTWRGV